MPVRYITDQISYPPWASERFRRLDIYQRFLDGRIYEHLKVPFYMETEHGTNAYIPLRERRPSIIYNLPRVVVNRSTRLLFGGKHWPKLITSDQPTTEFLQHLNDTTGLQATMLEAAFVGSIGSVAIFFSIKDGKFFYEVRNSRWCTPKFDENRDLLDVLIMYPVLGTDLRATGYAVDDDDLNEAFFYAKRHTKKEEVLYIPIKVDEYQDERDLVRDSLRSTAHGLGFVPGVWVKNLYPTDGIDGECTFGAILNIAVELDYQLSQCGRGLKYNADPQLLIKEPSGGSQPSEQLGLFGPAANTVRSASNAIFVGEEGDAKLLEINGQGQKAVLEFVKQIRQYALEVVSSSRKDPERAYGNMSGRAMEILDEDLISLASTLRLFWGENGLKLLLVKMLKAAAHKRVQLISNDPTTDSEFDIELYWGSYFDPTPIDHLQEEQALDIAVNRQRLYMYEARMLSAQRWAVGMANAKELEEQWPIPPSPPLAPADQIAMQKAKSTGVNNGGSDGRDSRVAG